MPGAPRCRPAAGGATCARLRAGHTKALPGPPPALRALPPPPAAPRPPRGRAPSPGRALPRPRGGGAASPSRPPLPASPGISWHLFLLFIYLFFPGAACLKALEASPPPSPVSAPRLPAGRGRGGGGGQRGCAGPKPGQCPGRARDTRGRTAIRGEPQPPRLCLPGRNKHK